LYLVRNGEIIITKADKQSIGGTEESKKFTNHTFKLQKDDAIYIFSDGFADQFGGENLPDSKHGGKKFGYPRFRKLLLSLQSEPINKQISIIDKTFKNWKGELEQIDDVCIIGLKIQ